jgi:hypothetical protein
MSRTFRRLTAVLILALLAGAGAAQALPAKAKGPDRPHFQNPLASAWSWVASIVEKAGSFIDPNGNWLTPVPSDPATTAVEAGSFIDPNGNS